MNIINLVKSGVYGSVGQPKVSKPEVPSFKNTKNTLKDILQNIIFFKFPKIFQKNVQQIFQKNV